MPDAIAEPPATGKSFADQFPAPSGASEEEYIDPAAAGAEPEPAKAAAPEKTIETAAEKVVEKTVAKAAVPDANPNLDDPPAAKVEDKTAAKPADDSDEIPAEYLTGMTKKAQDKARETWKGNKEGRKTAEAALDTIKAENTTLKKQLEDAGKSVPELESIRKELAEARAERDAMKDEISISRVELTPQFKAQVTAQQKASEGTAAALATKYEVGAAALLDAIREPDVSKQADLIEELSADFKKYDQIQLIDAAKSYAAAQKAAIEMRTNAGAKLEELTKADKQEAERIATGNIADYRKAAGEAWKALQEHNPIIRPVEGKQDWNDFLAAEAREVEAIDVNSLPVADVARFAASHQALPQIAKAVTFYQKQNADLREKLAAADERLGEYRKTEPGAGSGKTAAAKTAGDAGESFFDKVFESER